MKQTIRWVLVAVLACFIGSLATYRIAYHRGYKRGEISAIEHGYLLQSVGFFGALQKLRADDVPGATRLMESLCFAAAAIAYKDPQPPPNDAVARELARDLVKYRATYRTNSADWDVLERKLEVELAKLR